MWTRSARQEDGTFEVVVYDKNNEVFAKRSDFTESRDADAWGEIQQREALFDEIYGKVEPSVTMTIDEILAELDELFPDEEEK